MPTGKVQVTGSRVHSYGSRVLNAGFQRSPVGAVQLGYFQVFAVPVQPVQFPAHPVHGDTLETVAVVPDDLLAFGAAHFRPVYRLGAHVAEVQLLLRVIEVQGDHVEQVLMVERILRGVQRHVAHVILVGEDQPRFVLVAPLAGALVHRSVVVRFVALAVKRSGSVQTVLGTGARNFHAFVHVFASFTVFHQPESFKRIKVNLKFWNETDTVLA